MKVGKIWIVMILAALGFQVNAQRATFVHESYNSVRKYIHPLRLSHNQVADWSRLNRATDIAITDIERTRRMHPRTKARHIENVFLRHNRKLRKILSRRQFDRYNSMRANDRNSRYYNRGNACPNGYSNQGNQRNRDRYDDRDYDRNDRRNDNRDADYYNRSGSYYDGNYRS